MHRYIYLILLVNTLSLSGQSLPHEMFAGLNGTWFSSNNLNFGNSIVKPSLEIGYKYNYNFFKRYNASTGMGLSFINSILPANGDSLSLGYFNSGGKSDNVTFNYTYYYLFIPFEVYFTAEPPKKYSSMLAGGGINVKLLAYSKMDIKNFDEVVLSNYSGIRRMHFTYFFNFGYRWFINKNTLFLMKIKYEKSLFNINKMALPDITSNMLSIGFGVGF